MAMTVCPMSNNERSIIAIAVDEHGKSRQFIKGVEDDKLVLTDNLDDAIHFENPEMATGAIRTLNKLLTVLYRPARGQEIFKEAEGQVVVSAKRFVVRETNILTATFMKK